MLHPTIPACTTNQKKHVFDSTPLLLLVFRVGWAFSILSACGKPLLRLAQFRPTVSVRRGLLKTFCGRGIVHCDSIPIYAIPRWDSRDGASGVLGVDV